MPIMNPNPLDTNSGAGDEPKKPRLYFDDPDYEWDDLPKEWRHSEITDRDIAEDIYKCRDFFDSPGDDEYEQERKRCCRLLAGQAYWNITVEVRREMEARAMAKRKAEDEAKSDAYNIEMAQQYDTLPEVVAAARLKKGTTAYESAKQKAFEAAQAKGFTGKSYVNDGIKRIEKIIQQGKSLYRSKGNEANEDFEDCAHFKPLGTLEGSFYFVGGTTQEIVKISARALTQTSGLLQLAEYSYWQGKFSGEDGSVAIVRAADALMRACERKGVFDPSMVRGRGIWFDEGRVIVHLGDKLLVDGVVSTLTIDSKYMYVRRPAIDVDLSSPMSIEDGKTFLALVEMGAWVGGSVAARYAAGQVVCAAICGALSWRPHSWLVGQAESGKSSMVSSIIKPALGNMLLHALGGTSEAGIRQTLRGDALAVLYDEADAENEREVDTLKGVLNMTRVSSGEDGGAIFKGSSGGVGVAAAPRSCFIFASIYANSLTKKADKTRIEVSELDKGAMTKTAADFEASRAALLTDGFGARFCARAIRMVTTIRANAKTFSAALLSVLESQRSSDLHGALLAGAYSLESDDVLTAENAEKLVKSYGITKEKAHASEPSDQAACWHYLLQCRINVLNDDGHHESLSVNSLIDIACATQMTADEYEAGSDAIAEPNVGFGDSTSTSKVNQSEALSRLRAVGFAVKSDGDGRRFIAVSIRSKDIADMLKSKPQWSDYKAALKRIPGAKMSEDSISFGSKANKHYAVIVPYDEEKK